MTFQFSRIKTKIEKLLEKGGFNSIHGILQASGLQVEWVAIFFSRVSSGPGDPTSVSCIAGRFFYCLSH